MGVGVSSWSLAQAVSKAGQLGVVSGTAIDVILARRLQLGDPGGHMRRALERFPIPGVARRLLDDYFIPGGKSKDAPFKAKAIPTEKPSRRREELLVASNFVGSAYVHHYAVCSDLPHLAQAYAPVLVATLALAALRPGLLLRASVLAALLLTSAWTALEGRQELRRFAPGGWDVPLVRVEIADEELVLKASIASLYLQIRQVVSMRVGADEELFIAPTMPMWYPLLGKRTPVWWIYFLWPAPEEEQRALIAELEAKGVNWALINERPLNGRIEFNFDNTYPLVWAHFAEDWGQQHHKLLPDTYRLFRRKDGGQGR